jgi:hypothetical protein
MFFTRFCKSTPLPNQCKLECWNCSHAHNTPALVATLACETERWKLLKSWKMWYFASYASLPVSDKKMHCKWTIEALTVNICPLLTQEKSGKAKQRDGWSTETETVKQCVPWIFLSSLCDCCHQCDLFVLNLLLLLFIPLLNFPRFYLLTSSCIPKVMQASLWFYILLVSYFYE